MTSLVPWVRHTSVCPKTTDGRWEACACGLDDALRARAMVSCCEPVTAPEPAVPPDAWDQCADISGLFAWVGIEREAEYVAIAEARLNGTQRGMAL